MNMWPVVLKRFSMSRVEPDVGEVRRDLHVLSDRVVRIEGALTDPWRPANGSPETAPSTEAGT